MSAFFVYILQSAVCLAILFLFYSILLSRETFYRYNRVALLCLNGQPDAIALLRRHRMTQSLLHSRLCCRCATCRCLPRAKVQPPSPS